MFKFLKDKIKETISKISKKIEAESIEVKEPELKEKIKQTQEEKIEVLEEPKVEEKTIEEINISKEEPEIADIKTTEKILEKEKPLELVHEIEEKQEISEEDLLLKEEESLKEIPEKDKIIKQPEKKGFFRKIKDKLKRENNEDKNKEFKKAEVKEEIKETEKKTIFETVKEKITTTKITEGKFNELFEDLEISLLENNVAFEVVEKIKEDLKKDLLEKPIKRGEIELKITEGLKESIEDLFLTPQIDLVKNIKEKQEKPFVICFLGQNGSGKTTSIAKIANLLKKNNISVIMSASDTFRAAAIQQLKEWGKKLDIKVIANDYGSDPAAVAFDAIAHARAHKIEVVLVDTAGRQHSNKDLLREMEKIVRVTKPDLKIFVGEAITGNDCTEQAKEFNETVNIDGIILTKADIDEKGGAIISTSFVVHKPILYLGTGQEPEDLKKFNKEEIIKSLGF